MELHDHTMITEQPGGVTHHVTSHHKSHGTPAPLMHDNMTFHHFEPVSHHNTTAGDHVVHRDALGGHEVSHGGHGNTHTRHGETNSENHDGAAHEGHHAHIAGTGGWEALLNFGNASSPSPCEDSSYCIAEQVIVIAVPILIVIGNLITISVLLKTKSFRNCHGYFLLSLAFADLMMGPVAMAAIFPAFHHYWPFGVAGCFVTAYIAEVCMKVSLLMLLCLSIERYIAICHPFHYVRIVTTRNTVIAITVSWVACNLIYLLTIPTQLMCFTFEVDKYLCTVTYFLHPEYVIGVVLAFLVPSLLVVTGTNSITSYRIFQREFGSGLANNAIRQKDTCEMRVHTKKNKRVFRVLVTLLLVFYMCWLPYIVLHIYAYANGNTWELNHYLEFYWFWLAIANSCFNPMIYFGMNRTFKRAAILIIKQFISRVSLGTIYSDAQAATAESSVQELKPSSSVKRSDQTDDQSNGINNPVFEAEAPEEKER